MINWLKTLMLLRLLILVIELKVADYDMEIEDSDITKIHHDKYFTANKFIAFSGEIFDERLKHTKLTTNNALSIVEQRSIKNVSKRKILRNF